MTSSNESNDAVFVVLCKTIHEIESEENLELNAFIIDKNTPGLKLNEQLTNFNGLNLYEIEFENVKLTNSDLLGVAGSGHEISSKISEDSRHLVGAVCTGLVKNIFEKTVDFVINSRRFDKSLSDFEIIKDRIADIETKLYTMERSIF